MKQKHYARFSIEDREVISRGLSANLSYAEIARQIGQPSSTVSREVKNNYGRYSYRCCSGLPPEKWSSQNYGHRAQ